MEHYQAISPSEAWKERWGWFLRIRGIITEVIISLCLISISHYYQLNLTYVLFFFITGLFGCGLLFVLRYERMREARMNKDIHELCHSVRDNAVGIINKALSGSPDYLLRFENFHQDVVDRVATYFRNSLKDGTIKCAIRLAKEIILDGAVTQGYVTVARSKGMDASRAELSVPIPSDKGVALMLRQKNNKGVYICRNIPEAIREGTWLETPTDKLSDIKTVMIAPINGYVNIGEQKSMLGLLYIGSEKNSFRQINVEPLKAIADILGFVYPIITGVCEGSGNEEIQKNAAAN